MFKIDWEGLAYAVMAILFLMVAMSLVEVFAWTLSAG